MIPQKALNVQISQKIEELTQKLAIAEQRAELAEQQRDSCQAFILDLKAERDQLAAENIEQRETIADLEQRNDDQAGEISRYIRKIAEYDQEFERLYKLLSNPELSLTEKAFLWMYRRKILETQPEITARTRVCLEDVAGQLGMKRDTARRANKSLAEKCHMLTVEHEKTELDNGDTRTLVYISLNDQVEKAPEFIHKDGGNTHGGRRIYSCGKGHTNVDRLAAQYCRECDTTAFFGLPGLRADYDLSKVINSIVRANTQKQVAFGNVPAELPVVVLPPQSSEQSAAAVAVAEKSQKQVASTPIAAIATVEPQKQVAFGNQADKKPHFACRCGADQWKWSNLQQRWTCNGCNSPYNRLI